MMKEDRKYCISMMQNAERRTQNAERRLCGARTVIVTKVVVHIPWLYICDWYLRSVSR